MNKSLLLVRYQEAQESKYQTPLGGCLLVSFSLAIFALPGLKSLGSSSLLSLSPAKAAILVRFYFTCRCLELDDLSNLFLLMR